MPPTPTRRFTRGTYLGKVIASPADNGPAIYLPNRLRGLFAWGDRVGVMAEPGRKGWVARHVHRQGPAAGSKPGVQEAGAEQGSNSRAPSPGPQVPLPERWARFMAADLTWEPEGMPETGRAPSVSCYRIGVPSEGRC